MLNSRRRFFAIAAGVLLCLATLSTTTIQAKDNWTSVRSQNFLLVGDASEQDIRQVANRLEQFRKVFSLLLPGMKATSPVPTTVIVFKNDSSYKPFKVNPQAAGYFQAGEDANYITLTTEQAGDDNSLRTIFHEYVHLLVDNTMGHSVPLWFNEGLAEYYSTFKVVDENRKVVLGHLIRSHVSYLRANELLPLRTLFAVDNKSPYYNESSKVNIFYAESWVLLHYLLQADNQRRRPQLDYFIDLIHSNVAIDDAFQRAFQTNIETLERELAAYIHSGHYKATAFTFGHRVEVDSEMRSAPVTDAEAQAYLGDLLLHINRLDAAETRLLEALNLNPDLGVALTSLGMLRLRQGRFDEAKQYLQKAVAADSQNYLTHYYYAFALSREGMDDQQVVSRYSRKLAETMRAELRKAIALKIDFPESYALLAFVNIVRNEELDDTIALLKRAQTISRANQRVLFMLAQLYKRKQQFAVARELMEPIARNSPDPQWRERAQDMLEGLSQAEAQMGQLKAMGEDAAASANIELTGQEEELPPTLRDPSADLTAALRNPRDGEIRVQGMLTGIECNPEGITFLVRVGERLLGFHTDTLQDALYRTFTKDVAGYITCGPRKPENSVIVSYLAPAEDRKSDGRPTAFEFVPNDFQLKKQDRFH